MSSLSNFYKTIFIICFSLFVYGHNVLTYPKPRSHKVFGYPTDHVPASRIWQEGAPIEATNGRNDSAFTCRNRAEESPHSVIEAGKNLTVKYDVWASHPGDCALYVSYDLDPVPDVDKRWVKIFEWRDCGCNNEEIPCPFVPVVGQYPKQVEVQIPAWLPQANHAIFRYEMYATHMRFTNEAHRFMLVELYANCADVQIINKNPNITNRLPSPTYKIMSHLPTDPAKYRAQWDLYGPTAFPVNSNEGSVDNEKIISGPLLPVSSSNTDEERAYTPFEYPIHPDSGLCTKASRGLSPEQKSFIWQAHNDLREKIAAGTLGNFPAGAGLPELIWDIQLTNSAQAYSDTCPTGKSDEKESGENFFLIEGEQGNEILKKIVKSWIDEVNLFDTSLIKNYKKSEKYEDFSQMVWAQSTKIGCGSTSFFSDSKNSVVSILVCKYSVKGNIEGQPVYVPGASASACMAKSGNWGSLCWTSPEGKPYVLFSQREVNNKTEKAESSTNMTSPTNSSGNVSSNTSAFQNNQSSNSNKNDSVINVKPNEYRNPDSNQHIKILACEILQLIIFFLLFIIL